MPIELRLKRLRGDRGNQLFLERIRKEITESPLPEHAGPDVPTEILQRADRHAAGESSRDDRAGRGPANEVFSPNRAVSRIRG
jgi:hypothetical protein